MPLQLLTLITLAIIVLALVLYNRKQTPFGVYIFLFLGLFVLGKLTIRSYLYPKQHIFGNHQFHFLEHQGFRFIGNQPVLLASARNPEKALYNTATGDLSVHGNNKQFTIKANGFGEPLYVAEKPGRAIKKMYFRLANATSGFNAASGFGLESGGESLHCIISEKNEWAQYIFTHTGSNGAKTTDTSSFRLPVKYGLPLITLLRQTGLPVSDALEEQCNALLLVREKVYGDLDEENKSALHLFPASNQLLANTRFFDANKQPVRILEKQNVEVPLQPNQLFYTGYMQRAANNTDDPVWYMDDAPTGKQLKLLMPARFELPVGDSVLQQHKVLFVASGSDDVISNNFGAGYLLPWFSDSSGHRLHTLSYFHFTPGSARDLLLFHVTDLKAPEQTGSITVRGNQPFFLKTAERGTE
ncbi:MAG: hypothetical protein JNM68_08105, partial [Dinghuibacter sp.]|nr:hypothetical protein [Dinghuibacter sp.]